MAQTSVKAIPLFTFNAANLLAGYQAMNVGGLPHACFLIRFVNDSNADVTISYDGINDNEYIPNTTEFNLNAQTNAQPNAKEALIPKFTVIYVKGSAGVGTLSLSGYYV